MSKHKHTPGPWHVEPDQPSHGECLCIVAARGSVIARTPQTKKYDCAEQRRIDVPNANLLAAAPTMLKELEFLADAWADEIKHDKSINGADLVEWLVEVHPGLLKVIRQAKGKA